MLSSAWELLSAVRYPAELIFHAQLFVFAAIILQSTLYMAWFALNTVELQPQPASPKVRDDGLLYRVLIDCSASCPDIKIRGALAFLLYLS